MKGLIEDIICHSPNITPNTVFQDGKRRYEQESNLRTDSLK